MPVQVNVAQAMSDAELLEDRGAQAGAARDPGLVPGWV